MYRCCPRHCRTIRSSQLMSSYSPAVAIRHLLYADVSGAPSTSIVSATACASLYYSRTHQTTVPVWSNVTTLHCYRCSTNTLRSSSSNHVRILMRHGMTDNAGLPNELRDALSAPIAETSPNQIVQLGSTSPSYCTLLCASATSLTDQRRSLILMT